VVVLRNRAVSEAFVQESLVPNPKEVKKPWGRFIQYTLNQPTTVKILEVNPGEILSLQSHNHRDELWVPLTSGAVVEIDGHVMNPGELEPVFIPRYTKHRLSAKDQKVRVLEISFGTFDEEDVVRYEDKYGRSTQNAQERRVEK
jgi:mannose-1-phosphate guanylyltransferase/mannose-6-phosphate isomerase